MNILLESAPEWQERGLCAQTDPECFFPERGGSTRQAKRICNRCEVKAECLAYALDHDEKFGIWGGLSERERRRLKRAAPGPTEEPAAVAAVRRLAGAGLRDPEIGRETGRSPKAVEILRRRNEIAAGQPTGGGRLRDIVRGGVR